MVELVDTADLKSAGLYYEGSSPFGGTREARESVWLVSRATAKAEKPLCTISRKTLLASYIFAKITAPIMEIIQKGD